MKERLLHLNLRMFDGEAPASAPAGEGTNVGEATTTPSVAKKGNRAKSELANVVYGKQAIAEQEPIVQDEPQVANEGVVTKTPEEREAEFTRLLNEEYKDLDTKRMQSIIDKRFKDTKILQSQVEAVSPILDILASKYGVESSDIESLAQAIQDDESLFEEEAMERGLTVEQLKEMRRMEHENAKLKRIFDEQQEQERANQRYSAWLKDAEKVQEIYPNFALGEEVKSEEFIKLLQNGIDMKTAYEVIHHDEVIGGAMQYTAQQVQQKVVNNIKSRANRPTENGGSSTGAVVTKTDVKSLSKKDREEISRRVARGETISF